MQDLRVTHVARRNESLLTDRAMGQPRPCSHVTPTSAIATGTAQIFWPGCRFAQLSGCVAATGCQFRFHDDKMWLNGL